MKRPIWQEQRGERYGNLRRQQAELKVRARRIERAKSKRESTKQIETQDA